eukprot:364184-Chlamydomonas_euryale.AAC.4
MFWKKIGGSGQRFRAKAQGGGPGMRNAALQVLAGAVAHPRPHAMTYPHTWKRVCRSARGGAAGVGWRAVHVAWSRVGQQVLHI